MAQSIFNEVVTYDDGKLSDSPCVCSVVHGLMWFFSWSNYYVFIARKLVFFQILSSVTQIGIHIPVYVQGCIIIMVVIK